MKNRIVGVMSENNKLKVLISRQTDKGIIRHIYYPGRYSACRLDMWIYGKGKYASILIESNRPVVYISY